MSYKNFYRAIKSWRIFTNKPIFFVRVVRNYAKVLLLGKKVPRSIEVAVTYNCQCKCKHCSAGKISSTNDYLDLNQMVSVVNEYVRNGAIHLHITGGEPLIYDHLFEFIGAVGPKRIYISLVSNGLELTRDMAVKLKDAHIDILQLSLDSMYPAVHDANRGVKGSYKKTIDGIKNAKIAGLNVGINVVLTKDKVESGEIWELLDFVERMDILMFLIVAVPCGQWQCNYDILLGEKEKEVLAILEKHKRVFRDLHFAYAKYKCPAGSERVHVTAFGGVYPCPFIQKSYGNVKTESINKIWRKMCDDEYFKVDHAFCPAGEDIDFITKIYGPFVH